MIPIITLYFLLIVSFLEEKKIYDLSFFIYALHSSLIGLLWSIINYAYAKVPIAVTLCNIFTSVINLSVDICLAAMIYFVLKRLSPKLLHIITGEEAKMKS